MPSPYYEQDLSTLVQAGHHRDLIGGLWDEMGRLQLDFLTKQGMQPHHLLMDIGCGALRLGCLAVDYLDNGNYYGIDLSDDLLSVGYNKELTDRQRERLPRSHLFATSDFDFAFLNDRKMNYAVAQSVFTHLPLNHLRDCLIKLQTRMVVGSAFYASFFLCPDHHDISLPIQHPVSEANQTAVTTYSTRDPYHYHLEDLEYCAKNTNWKFQFIGDWDHPRNQKMAAFILQS